MWLDADAIVNSGVAFYLLCCKKKVRCSPSSLIKFRPSTCPQNSFSNQLHQIPLFGLILLYFFCMDLHSTDLTMTVQKLPMATLFAVRGRDTHVIKLAEILVLSTKILFLLCTVVVFCIVKKNQPTKQKKLKFDCFLFKLQILTVKKFDKLCS